MKNVLQVLEEQYEKNTPYYIGASRFRAKLDIPPKELRNYVWFLKGQGYVSMIEGPLPSGSFIVKLNKEGHNAYLNHQITV